MDLSFLIIAGVIVVALIALLGFAATSEMRLLKAAAKNKPVNKDKLSDAYWKLYQDTYKRKSEWMLMNKKEKSDVFAAREELRDLFDRLPKIYRDHIISHRPKRMNR